VQVQRPPITITCECGTKRAVPYGERWRCEQCGRSWNTLQIPAEEYEGLVRRVRRHQLEVLGMLAIAALIVVPLIVISPRFILLTPLAMAAWIFFVIPAWRRRYRRTAREAPRWDLHPE